MLQGAIDGPQKLTCTELISVIVGGFQMLSLKYPTNINTYYTIYIYIHNQIKSYHIISNLSIYAFMKTITPIPGFGSKTFPKITMLLRHVLTCRGAFEGSQGAEQGLQNTEQPMPRRLFKWVLVHGEKLPQFMAITFGGFRKNRGPPVHHPFRTVGFSLTNHPCSGSPMSGNPYFIINNY